MARNEAEYQKLKQLRQAIVNKSVYQQRQQEVSKRLANMGDPKLPAKPSLFVCTQYSQKAEQDYAHPAFEAARRRAKRLNTLASAAKTGVAVLLALGVLALIVWLYVAMMPWLSEISLSKMTLPDGDGQIFIAVHLFTLALLLGIATAIVSFTADAWGVIPGILTGISLIASIVMYCGQIDGFGAFIGALFAPFMLIGDFFVALFAEVILLIPAGVVALIIVWVCLKCDWFENVLYGHEFFRAPEVDFTPLYQTEEYAEAKKRDEAVSQKFKDEYPALLAKYVECCQLRKENHAMTIRHYQEQISTYKNAIAECDKIINGATFLHSSYRNTKMIDTILYYIDHNRAETITQAMNKYDDDEHKRAQLKLKKDEIEAINNYTRRMQEEARRNREAEEARMARMEAMKEEEMRQRERIAEDQARAFERACESRNEYLSDINRKIGFIEDDVYRYTH